MITISTEQLEKIRLLDILFSTYSIDDLRNIANPVQVISRLKGSSENNGVLLSLVQNSEFNLNAIINLQREVESLKSDIFNLVTIISSLSYVSVELLALKTRYDTY